MCVFNDMSWNSDDLIACSNAADIIASDYGVDVLIELDNKGCFGNLDITPIIDKYV